MRTEEDDEFERIQRESGWRKKQVATTIRVPDLYRNYILEEVAQEFDKMKFGDTSQSFAIFVRNMKR
jgi:hypothetical protein